PESSPARTASTFAVEASGSLTDETPAAAIDQAASAMSLKEQPIFTYLANSLRSGGRGIPYSLVTATDLPALGVAKVDPSGLPPVVLNDWAARDLGVKVGGRLTMEYYVWEDPGRLLTRTA